MIKLASSPFRTSRILVASAILALLVAAAPSAAWAAGGPSDPTATDTGANGTSESSLQIEAQELAGQIQADGQSLDQLGAEYNAAEIRSGSLTAQMGSLRQAMTKTSQLVSIARQDLQAQAVMAYVAGGSPAQSFESGQAAQDPSLTEAYAEIVAGDQKRTIDTYRAALAEQSSQARQLASDARQAAITLTDLRADQSAADATLAARQQTLMQVKGHIATLVAQVQARQQQAEESAVEASLARNGGSAPGDSREPAIAPSAQPAVATVKPAQPVATTKAPRQPGAPATTPTTAPTTAPERAPGTTTPITRPPSQTTSTTVAAPAPSGGNTPAPGSQTAMAYARAQIGKPYQWGGAGPGAFDCSGLVMMAWEQAGVDFPHLAQDQYDMTARVAIADLLPGDLVFYGTPDDVYHVGLYIGGGDMIDAPATGQNVSIQSIYWDGLLGGGRV